MSNSQRFLRAAEKAAREMHQLRQQEVVDQKNSALQGHLNDLHSILEIALTRSFPVDQILSDIVKPPYIPPPSTPPKPPAKEDFESRVPPPTFMERQFGIGRKKRLAIRDQLKKQYEQAVENYKLELNRHNYAEQGRQQLITKRQQMLSEYHAKLAIGDTSAVTTFFLEVLNRSRYPEVFPQPEIKLGFKSETGELIVEYDLPTYQSIMPTVKEYRYVKTRDVIEEKGLNKTDEKEMKELYEDVIAGIALRTLHEIFSSDIADVIKLIIFNGMVNTIDRATGRSIRPCLVSVQASRDDFQKLDLSRVDKRACLKHLKAQTSPSSKEMVPVKPLVELITTDDRFVDEVEVLSQLDTRPNLLEMTPQEFEHLIANLFTEMGFKTGTTQISRDGGVDVIAFDERPIVGGKIVIQAKRYRNTVGVESVRALYGVMQDEGATKGIMVCTSTFGVASREFAKDKPIELIDGNGLLHYLREHGHEAKIEVPQS